MPCSSIPRVNATIRAPTQQIRRPIPFSQFPEYARPIDGTRKANIPAITGTYFQD